LAHFVAHSLVALHAHFAACFSGCSSSLFRCSFSGCSSYIYRGSSSVHSSCIFHGLFSSCFISLFCCSLSGCYSCAHIVARYRSVLHAYKFACSWAVLLAYFVAHPRAAPHAFSSIVIGLLPMRTRGSLSPPPPPPFIRIAWFVLGLFHQRISRLGFGLLI
jgi:hypothetical protein